MKRFAKRGKLKVLLEAEVAESAQRRFERRYDAATGIAVTPGNPVHYQGQPNKWGAELRVYFNDPGMAVSLTAKGLHVEFRRAGYMSGEYSYRVNDNTFWWKLVEGQGLRLGVN
jgi:hypothetical protein